MPKFLSSFQNTLSVIANVARHHEMASTLGVRQSLKSPIINHQSLELPSQKGQSSAYSKGASSTYIILFVIVVIFAVMMSGGASSLFSGNHPSSVIDTPTPTGGTTPTLSPSPTPDPNWTISVVLSSTCQAGKSPFKSGNIVVNGAQNGTLNLEIESTPNNWTVDVTSAFNAPNTNYTLNLPNDSGYNTKNWRLRVLSGGTEKAVKPGLPTGCT